MLGFAVVDHRSGSDTAAVWLTNRVTTSGADHGNAVKIDLGSDVDALRKIHALTRDRLVVLTEGSTADGLPITAATLSVGDVGLLVAETVEHQRRIVDAIDAYAKRTRNKNLVRPAFREPLSPGSFEPSEDTATQRAFQTANYVARAWSEWLTTDDERRRRAENPRTKKSPWIMPTEMGSPVVADFPAAFIERVAPQPLEAFHA